MLASNKNIHSLHIIRGLAALIVVVYHAKFILWAGGSLWIQHIGFRSVTDYVLFGIDMLSSCGEQCVLVFFLLSGFVIYHSFQNSNRKLKHFFIIRGLRIYIPYLVSLAVSMLVLYACVTLNSGIAVNGIREYNTRLLIAYNEIGLPNTFKTLLFIKGNEYAGFNFVYWSLLHEAVFYLVFPVYFYAGIRWRALLMILFLLLFIFTRHTVFYYQLFFLAGMFLYDYYAKNRKQLLPAHWYLPLIVVLYFATNLLTKSPSHHYANIAALLLALLAFDYLLTGKSYNKAFKALADMSFTLYLNHLWILLICYCIAYRGLHTLVIYQRWPYYISVLVTIPVCWWLYLLIEKRSLTIISKLKNTWKSKGL